MRRLAFALCLLTLAAPIGAHAETKPAWAEDTAPETQAACRKAGALALPTPESAGPAAKDCDTIALTYGIGRAPDYQAARACALHAPPESDDIEKQAFDGPAALAMIYANGLGVPRNDDLALAFACKAGGAPAEIDGRVKHLLERKARGAAATDRFDICDDVTSGLMQGACQWRDSALDAVKRKAVLAALTGSLPNGARTAYAALDEALANYAATLGDNEVDLSGTARAAMVIGAKDAENAAFLGTLRKVMDGKLPAASPAARAAADAALNAAYKKALALKSDDLGTVTSAGIKATERSWLVYRDAFVAFARIAAPKVSADAIATVLTQKRTADLKELAGDGN